MNAIIIAIPIFIIRYGLLSILNKEALKRASFFAPVVGREKIAFWAYQISSTFILLYLLFLKIRIDSEFFYLGLLTSSIGIILYAVSAINYSNPNVNGVNQNGLYHVSRNPMYVAFFIYFIGGVFLTNSLLLLVLLVVFQMASHWIILSEERWCIQEFGAEYLEYMKKVRRYI